MPRKKNQKIIDHLKAIRPLSTRPNVDELIERMDDDSELKSSSRKKIERMGTAEHVQSDDTEQYWILAHVAQLTRLVDDLLCPDCRETGLSIAVCDGEQHGFSAKLSLRCDGCGYQNFEMSSPRIQDSEKRNISYEINPKMVMFSHEVGGSHTVLTAFGTVIGMPTMHLKTYQRQDKKVTGMCFFCDLLSHFSIIIFPAC